MQMTAMQLGQQVLSRPYILYSGIVSQEQPGGGKERAGVTGALPEKTLGILVRKLFTVRMGMPFFSSCMRAITSSIWRRRGRRKKEE